MYDADDLYTFLARVIVQFPTVPRWLLKIDNEMGGRGVAYFEPSALKVYNSLMADRDSGIINFNDPHVVAGAEERMKLALKQHIPSKIVLATPHAVCTCGPPCLPISGPDSCATINTRSTKTRGIPMRKHFIALAVSLRLLRGPNTLLALRLSMSSSNQMAPSPSPAPMINSLAHRKRSASCLPEKVLFLTHVLCDSYVYAGATFPSKFHHASLHEAATSIAKVCFKEGIIGHIGACVVLLECE